MVFTSRMITILENTEEANMKIKRGDIFLADLSPVFGAEMGEMRYVVVLQNNEFNDEAS